MIRLASDYIQELKDYFVWRICKPIVPDQSRDALKKLFTNTFCSGVLGVLGGVGVASHRVKNLKKIGKCRPWSLQRIKPSKELNKKGFLEQWPSRFLKCFRDQTCVFIIVLCRNLCWIFFFNYRTNSVCVGRGPFFKASLQRSPKNAFKTATYKSLFLPSEVNTYFVQ